MSFDLQNISVTLFSMAIAMADGLPFSRDILLGENKSLFAPRPCFIDWNTYPIHVIAESSMNSRFTQIGREVVRKFHTGKWQQQAAAFLADQKKMKALVLVLTVFFRKRSLAPVLKDAVMLYHYVRDIVSGRYAGYSGRQLTLVVAVLLYVVSPLDLIPDFLAGIGFLDDAALVSYAIRLVDKELCRYLQWKDSVKPSADASPS